MDNPACLNDEIVASKPANTDSEQAFSQEELDFKAAMQLDSELNKEALDPGLQSSIQYQHQIHITLAQAKLSRTHSFYGLSRMDPYVQMRYGHKVYQTPTAINGDRNPKWDQTVICPFLKGLAKFSVQIYDSKTFQQDQMIAQAEINLPVEIFNGTLIDEWYPLCSAEGESGEGLINVIISYQKVPVQVLPNFQNSPAHAVNNLPPPVTINDEDVNSLSELAPELDRDIIRSVLVEKAGNKDLAANVILAMVAGELPPANS